MGNWIKSHYQGLYVTFGGYLDAYMLIQYSTFYEIRRVDIFTGHYAGSVSETLGVGKSIHYEPSTGKVVVLAVLEDSSSPCNWAIISVYDHDLNKIYTFQRKF